MKIIFLDRDGVINEFPGYRKYVENWEQFKFIPGSIEAIKLFKEHAYTVLVISNQAGVSKGIYSKGDLDTLTNNMRMTLREQGTDVDGVYYCLHQDQDNCKCRKPKSGLLKMATQGYNVNLKETFFIGDSFRDLAAAKEFGCRGALVLSGRHNESDKDSWEYTPEYVFNDLLEAARFFCSNHE